jgi:hypothetical protein
MSDLVLFATRWTRFDQTKTPYPTTLCRTKSSGVGVDQECQDTFQELKLGKTLKYVIFGMSEDKKNVVVYKKSDSPDYDKFLEDLPEVSRELHCSTHGC